MQHLVQQTRHFKGSRLLIWFYPKASTGGCTKEGISIRDEFKTFAKHNIEVVGISKDSIKAQFNFSEKNNSYRVYEHIRK